MSKTSALCVSVCVLAVSLGGIVWIMDLFSSLNVSSHQFNMSSKNAFFHDDAMLVKNHLPHLDEMEKISLRLSKRLSAYI